MKSRAFIVPHGGYPFDVLVAIGMSDAELRRKLRRLGRELDAEEWERVRFDDRGKGRTVMLRGGQTVMRLREWQGAPDDWAHLAHEIFHAVEFLMDRIGIELSDKSDEAFAYAIGGLTKRIVKELRR